MLRHTYSENDMRYYTYIGMARDLTQWNRSVKGCLVTPDLNITEDMADRFRRDACENIIRQAKDYRKESLYYDPYGYELQLLESTIITMQPYLSCYVRNNPKDIFYYGRGIQGVHYFKYFYHNDIPDMIKIGDATYKLINDISR